MNLLRVIGQSGLVITVFIFTSAVTYGWPGLSHIIITKEADYPELKFYANGPDTYKSMQEWYEGWMPSNYFAWTHSRLTVSGFIGPIVDPNYKGPAYDMWILATRKLEGLSGQELDVAHKTALGWCAHMAADRVVHWDYFPAPQDNYPLSALIWLQHKNMESGVNILTYVDKVCTRDLEVAFNIVLDEQGNRVGGDGSVKLEGGHWDGYWPQWPGHWGLVSLAQRVYLKNQRKTDETEDETIWPETANVIRDSAHQRLQELEDEIEGWTFGDFEDEIQKFDQLLTQPAENGTRTLHVKFVYSWLVGEQVQVFDSNGLLGDTGLIVSVDRHNRTITLDRDLSRDYPADGMSCVRYMPDDDWLPWEPRWEASVQAVQQQVTGLQAQ